MVLYCWSLAGLAQERTPGCAPVARVVSLQGTLQLQRVGQSAASSVRKLGTYLCENDVLHADAGSRAALFISAETLVRLDQNSTVRIRHTAYETVVEFIKDAAPLTRALLAPDQCGAGYFITRYPRRFRVITPFANAAVEGTEFLVALRCEATDIAVFEGKVRAELPLSSGRPITLTTGQSLSVGEGQPPVIKVLVMPIDAVQWLLYYPSLSDLAPEGEADVVCDAPSAIEKSRCLTARAERRLRAARVKAAREDIDEALKLAHDNADAHALSSVIRVALNEKALALDSAQRATTQLEPSNARAWIALSYAQQAAFKLEDALNSAEHAAKLSPQSSLARARVAELLMSLGKIRSAERAAEAAVAANPNESRSHTVLGFVHLAQINTKNARADFESAIERDSMDPLPHLGLGLAIIRDGKLKEGREEIEIAVALDPTNSLIRSYVGKAYYEENTKERDQLAASQFGLAKQLDPNDPTPWFYGAILKQTQNRPVEALQDLQKSIELNDNRAVYRSRLLLDQDLGSRSVNQARVFNELGSSQLGLLEATESLTSDPASYSAHRLLADTYARIPRYGIARASELLQAQLQQPLGAAPLQAQLANDVLFKTDFFGPKSVGINEFNPLFVRSDVGLQLFGLVGNERTYGDQVVLNALHGPLSLSVSQFRYGTDGFRVNNDDSQRQFDGFLQAQLSAFTSVQFEATTFRRNEGDLLSRFDPDAFDPAQRSAEELDTYRMGLKHRISSETDVLLSIISQDRTGRAEQPISGFFVNTIQRSWKAETQLLSRHPAFDLVTGFSYFTAQSTEELPFPFTTTMSHPYHFNAYVYGYVPVVDRSAQLQLGLSYDHLSSLDVGAQENSIPSSVWYGKQRHL
jgi:tetratricopeptide (TPR) repeat protein